MSSIETYTMEDLHLYLGPMKSGKTLQLINEIDSAERNGVRYLTLQPKKNIRIEDQGLIISRLDAGKGSEQTVARPAMMIESLGDVSELIDEKGITRIHIDELWMFGQAADRAVAEIQAIREANILREWLGKGVAVHAASLDRLANAHEPPMIQAVRKFKHMANMFTADCDFEGCVERATLTAIYDENHDRIPLTQLPDYVPQTSLSEDSATVYFHPYCDPHFNRDISIEDYVAVGL